MALGLIRVTNYFTWLVPMTVFVGFIVLYYLWLTSIKKKAMKSYGDYLYSLPQIPILGNVMTFSSMKDTTDLWKFVTEKCNKHREGISFWLFHLNWIFIQEVDVVEAILSSPECNKKAYVYSLLRTVTDGVFSCNGIRWKKLRKKLNLTFSQKQIDMYYDDVNEQAAICVQMLKDNANKYMNIQAFVTTFFADVVYRTHFGIESNEQFSRKYQMTERAAKIVELTMKHRFFNVFFHSPFIFSFTRLSKFIEHIKTEPLAFVRKIIVQRNKITEIEKEKGLYVERKKLIFLDMVRDVLNDLKIKPTPHNLERNTSDIIVAASDTTSVAVCSAFYYLALHPDIQEKVFREVHPIFGESSTKNLTKDDLSKMEYLEMVIKETLRHVAPAGIVRELTTDLDVGKYVIPKGTNAFIVIKAMHENPEYWEKPLEFYPDHFLPENVSKRPKYSFIPFSSGPRNCPGMQFSYVTMKTIISSVVRNFKIETNIPLQDIKFKIVLMQEFENSYSIKLTPRLP